MGKDGQLSVKVEQTTRNVIEKKLLTALEDDSVVAALLTQQDLECMIDAFRVALSYGLEIRDYRRVQELERGLRRLWKEAFGYEKSKRYTGDGTQRAE